LKDVQGKHDRRRAWPVRQSVGRIGERKDGLGERRDDDLAAEVAQLHRPAVEVDALDLGGGLTDREPV
jgi:hypothetical protein